MWKAKLHVGLPVISLYQILELHILQHPLPPPHPGFTLLMLGLFYYNNITYIDVFR